VKNRARSGARMNGGDLEQGDTSKLSEGYVENAVRFVINAHAATVNMRLYPQSSDIVTETLEKAQELLDKLFEEKDQFDVSALEHSLIVNDVRLEDTDQMKAPVKSFLAWMSERGLSNLQFRAGVTREELRTLFALLSEIGEDQELRARLPAELAERGVTNVSVNQRVYVALDTAWDGTDIAGVGLRKATPLDALKDELLIRYLMAKIDLGQVQDTDLLEVLSDPEKVGGLMSRFLAEEGSEGGVLIKSQRAEDALNRLSAMIEAVEDKGLRQSLADTVTSIISEMNPREMTSILTGQGPDDLDIRHVRQNVISMLKDEQLFGIVESLIDEYLDMKDQVGELDTEWTSGRLKDLNDLLLEVRSGAVGDVLSPEIDRKLNEAGIPEEREPSTGVRVLSASHLLGGPLEEEQIPDLGEGVDNTIPVQIQQLYSMNENELAAGLLLKLADNLVDRPESVRRFSAYLIRETLSVLDPPERIVAARVLEPRLAEAIDNEPDYLTFARETDSIAVIAEHYLREGRAEDASGIIELLVREASGDAEKRSELVQHASIMLARLIGPEGVVSAETLLSEENSDKLVRNVRVLSMLGPIALSPIVEMVKERGQMELRDNAVTALVAAGPAGAQALIAELSKKNSWYAYRNILDVLADIRCAEAVEQIGAMVRHPDERIRREAVRSLARIGDPGSLPTVLGATNDGSSAVRRMAVRALGTFKDPSVADYLFDIVFASGKGPRAKEEEGVAEAACLALGDLREKSLVPRLLQLVRKGGLFRKGMPDEVRAAACIALGTIGDTSAVPMLEKAAGDSSAVVRSSAEKSLHGLEGVVTAPEPVTEPSERPVVPREEAPPPSEPEPPETSLPPSAWK
jgi:HEAT repeat protein